MNITLACDQLQCPPTPEPAFEQVEALLLSIRRPPETMLIPKHSHAIMLPDGRCFAYCPELSAAMGREVFIPEGARQVPIAITLQSAVPTETLPAAFPDRPQPEPMHPLHAYEIRR